jgi:NDP-sugar pyrophosphorylase family protein
MKYPLPKVQFEYNMNSNLIILAGGASSRMNKSLEQGGTSNVPKVSKALIGMDKSGRPILDYLLFNAKEAGFKNVYLVVGEDSEGFKKCYGNKTKNSFKGLNIFYAIQYIPVNRTKPFGTADALFQALEQYPNLVNETFTVCNSDNLYSVEAFSILKNSSDKNAFIAYDRDGLNFTMERISRFALVLLNFENYLVDIIEKPSADKIDSYKDSFGKFRVSMNIFKLSGNMIYPFLKECPIHPVRNEKELPTAILNMCHSFPKTMKGYLFKEHVPDLTSKEDIEVLKTYIEKHFKA